MRAVSLSSKDWRVVRITAVQTDCFHLQPPEVRTVNQDVQLLEEGESLEVNAMRETYASLRSYLHALMAEVLEQPVTGPLYRLHFSHLRKS